MPLTTEDYFLVCLKDALEHPSVLRPLVAQDPVALLMATLVSSVLGLGFALLSPLVSADFEVFHSGRMVLVCMTWRFRHPMIARTRRTWQRLRTYDQRAADGQES